MFSFQRLGNYFEYRHNHRIHPKNHNNFSGHKQAWYSFEVLTKLAFSIIGASMSPTKPQISPAFQSTTVFQQDGSSGQKRKPLQEYDIRVFCDRYELLNTAQRQPPALLLSCSWVRGFLLYMQPTLHLCFQQTSNKAKLMNLLQHASV